MHNRRGHSVCRGGDSIRDVQDEILEQVWTCGEIGKTSIGEVMECIASCDKDVALDKLVHRGMVSLEADEIKFTKIGEEAARQLIRRHRLAECLFGTVFELDDDAMHEQACRLEHERVLLPEAMESICTLLGHPPSCPHGKPIPPGECCLKAKRDLRPLVLPLSEMKAGRTYKISFITQSSHKLLVGLGDLGIRPGVSVTLSQKGDSFVVEVDGSEVAMEREVASGIYVR